MTILPPNTLLQNRYLIVRMIAQGGMGVVYQATDQRLGHPVALKQTDLTNLPPQQAAQRQQQFLREARLLARLHHSALPNVSDFFIEQNGLLLFLVMPYIPGHDLELLLQQQGSPFPVSQVLQWADHLLDALEYLHSQRPPLIHRDIKPANIKFLPQGLPILLDFGISKGGKTHTTLTVTASSMKAFTLNYAPLEQINGTGTDQRSDLYSLGATLYHLLTGMLPPDAINRATAQVNQQPDPLRPANQLNRKVPPAIANVLTQAMALNKLQRFVSAKAMRQALRQAAQGQALHNATTKRHNRPQNPPPLVVPQQPTGKLGRLGNRLIGVGVAIYEVTDKTIDWIIDHAIIGVIGGAIIGAGSGAIYWGITGAVAGGTIGAIVGMIVEGGGKTIIKSIPVLIGGTVGFIINIIGGTLGFIIGIIGAILGFMIDTGAIRVLGGVIVGFFIGEAVALLMHGTNYKILFFSREIYYISIGISAILFQPIIYMKGQWDFLDFFMDRSAGFLPGFLLSFMYVYNNTFDINIFQSIFIIIVQGTFFAFLLGASGGFGVFLAFGLIYLTLTIIKSHFLTVLVMSILGGIIGWGIRR